MCETLKAIREKGETRSQGVIILLLLFIVILCTPGQGPGFHHELFLLASPVATTTVFVSAPRHLLSSSMCAPRCPPTSPLEGKEKPF